MPTVCVCNNTCKFQHSICVKQKNKHAILSQFVRIQFISDFENMLPHHRILSTTQSHSVQWNEWRYEKDATIIYLTFSLLLDIYHTSHTYSLFGVWYTIHKCCQINQTNASAQQVEMRTSWQHNRLCDYDSPAIYQCQIVTTENQGCSFSKIR
jgi:hypothetical protein